MPSPQTVSAIVAAYNEAKTVKPIIEVLLSHPRISQVIVVNDGSTDKTWAKINTIKNDKFVAINHPVNLGKGAAIASAVRKAKGDTLLLIDADLRKFHPAHVDLLLSPIEIDPDSMTIGIRPHHQPYQKPLLSLFKFLGGERALKKHALLPLLKRIEKSGYGIEAILNLHFLNRHWRIYYVPLPRLTHLFKEEKHPLYKYAVDYFHEGKQILKQYLQSEVGTTNSFLEYLTKALRV